MITAVIIFLLSVGALFYGADKLVDGACRIALRLGIPSAIIGLTIVSIGTSAPEIFTSIRAQFYEGGKGDVAIGNVIGSNLCNIGLILGLNAVILFVPVSKAFIKREMPFLLVLSFLFYYLAYDMLVSALEGILLFSIFIGYSYVLFLDIKKSRKEKKEKNKSEESAPKEDTPVSSNLMLDIGLIIFGCALLLLGGNFIIDSSITICAGLGLNEKIVGLLMVAFGTSCPELAASIVASIKKESDILIGNIVGSNIMNILIVIGITPMIKPIQLTEPTMISFDFPAMIILAIMMFLLCLYRSSLGRWRGALILCFYLLYTVKTSFPHLIPIF